MNTLRSGQRASHQHRWNVKRQRIGGGQCAWQLDDRSQQGFLVTGRLDGNDPHRLAKTMQEPRCALCGNNNHHQNRQLGRTAGIHVFADMGPDRIHLTVSVTGLRGRNGSSADRVSRPSVDMATKAIERGQFLEKPSLRARSPGLGVDFNHDRPNLPSEGEQRSGLQRRCGPTFLSAFGDALATEPVPLLPPYWALGLPRAFLQSNHRRPPVLSRSSFTIGKR